MNTMGGKTHAGKTGQDEAGRKGEGEQRGRDYTSHRRNPGWFGLLYMIYDLYDGDSSLDLTQVLTNEWSYLYEANEVYEANYDLQMKGFSKRQGICITHRVRQACVSMRPALKLEVRSWSCNNFVSHSQPNRKIHLAEAWPFSEAPFPPSPVRPCSSASAAGLPWTTAARLSKIRPYCQSKTFFSVLFSVTSLYLAYSANRGVHRSRRLLKTIYFQPLFRSAGLSKVPGTLNLFYWISLRCYNLETSVVQGCIIACEW